MTQDLAPIAFFAYKRADLAKNALASLKNCRLADQSHLTIYCDGSKFDRDRLAVEEVRRAVRAEKWCAQINIVERSENLGLSKSIRAGVSDLCEKYGRVIVLEDDLILHPSFLEFMNEGLSRYESDPRVMEISGYNYPVKIENESDAFFACLASCWGWGTWKRAWRTFDDSSAIFEELKSNRALRKKFDLGGAYPYFELLKKQLAGSVDSWGVFWYQTIFKARGLVLMPNQTLVCNCGAGIDGTHQSGVGFADVMAKCEVKKFPEVFESVHATNQIARFLLFRFRRPFFSRWPFSWMRFLAFRIVAQ